jgi:hypothetical protein
MSPAQREPDHEKVRASVAEYLDDFFSLDENERR